MASTIDIDAPLDAASELSISANIQKLRAKSQQEQGWMFTAENFQQIQRSVLNLERAMRQAPSVANISIDSADIQDLVVGGREGPGQLTILSGPPSYTRIGYDGTETTALVYSISTVSGATINTTVPHALDTDDIVLIAGCSSLAHLGYWVVDTVPTATSFTVKDPPVGTGSAGTVTFQYAGGWRRTFAIGGAGFDSAPFFADSRGKMYIGKNGSISLLDSQNVEKGFIGVETEPALVVSAVSNNGLGLIRLTVATHGWDNGDNILVFLLGSNADGDWMINVVDANHIDLRGSAFTSGYTTPGQAYRYFGPLWAQTIAAGGNGYSDASFRTFSDGSYRLGEPAGPRIEFDAGADQMLMTDASLILRHTGTTTEIGEIVATPGPFSTTTGFALTNDATGRGVLIGDGAILLRFSTSVTAAVLRADTGSPSSGGVLFLNNPAGVTQISIIGASGSGTFSGDLSAANLTVTGNISADTLTLTTGLTGYYTKAEIDAKIATLNTAIAGKANATHTHSTISISGTAGGSVAAHTHTGSVT